MNDVVLLVCEFDIYSLRKARLRTSTFDLRYMTDALMLGCGLDIENLRNARAGRHFIEVLRY